MAPIRRVVEGPARTLLSALKWQKAAMTNVHRPAPVYPVMSTSTPRGLKVHLGPGEINLQGWVNVDARDFDHVHAQTESLELTQFTDGALAVIYMCHVLEHVSFAEADALLRTFHRKLAPGGVMMISVPDFDAIVRTYQASGNDLESVKYALMGGQGYAYNFHKSVYNRAALNAQLLAAGFSNPQPWDTHAEFGTDIGDWSSAGISLNVKATKVDG